MNCPKRKETRLKEYDYSSPGYYFVAICTHERQVLFSEHVGAHLCVRPSPVPEFPVVHWMYEIEHKYPGVIIDSFCVMPDHIHVILAVTGAHIGAPLQEILQWYKTQSTNGYIRLVRNGILPPFRHRIWQKGYYEHVIRNDADLQETRQSIQTNPLKLSELTRTDSKYGQEKIPR